MLMLMLNKSWAASGGMERTQHQRWVCCVLSQILQKHVQFLPWNPSHGAVYVTDGSWPKNRDTTEICSSQQLCWKLLYFHAKIKNLNLQTPKPHTLLSKCSISSDDTNDSNPIYAAHATLPLKVCLDFNFLSTAAQSKMALKDKVIVINTNITSC